MKINYKRIGEQIKESRRRKNMTQATLAELTQMSDTFISRIETGTKRPSLDSIIKIAYVLKTSIDALVFGDGVDVVQSE